MKTEEQVNWARARLRERIQEPGLNNVQKALIVGMINAIVWVADGTASSTMERMLSDEPMAAGKDTKPAIERFDKKLTAIIEGSETYHPEPSIDNTP